MSDAELPKGWAAARLDEIAEVRLGRQRSPKNHSGTRMVPYLRAANVGWEGLLLDDVKQMNFTEDESRTFELRPGDIVLSEASGSIGEVGKPALWRGEIGGCCFQNTLIRVRGLGAIDPRFVLWRLRFEALDGRWARGFARGVGIHHLGSTRLSTWEFVVPPLAEQLRIVDELERRLSHVDAAEASLRATARRLAIARESVIFRTVLPAESTADEGDDLATLPPGWEWSTLGEVADVVGGVTKDSKRQADPEFIEVPYLRVANVQRGYLDLSEVTAIRVSPAKAKALRLEVGDVLFNEGGDRDKLGRGWVWGGQVPDCIHQNHVFRARLHETRLAPEFVSHVGNTFGRRWFEAAGKQTTNLASINKTTLQTFPMPVPPPGVAATIVREIERRLSLIDAAAQAVEASLAKAANLRRSLLAAAFAGRLVVQDPNDEPADVLLERIRAERAATPARKRAPHGSTPKHKEEVA